MKSTIKVSLLLLLALSQGSYGATQEQNDWGEILSNIQDSQTGEIGYLYDTNEQRRGTLYNSSVEYQFSGGDGNGDFGASERVNLVVTMPGGKKIETGSYLTADELADWADAHAEDLLKAVFGTDPSATVSGSTTTVAQASQEIVQQVSASKQRTKTRTVKQTVKAKKEEKSKEKKAVSYDAGFNSLVMMDSEKASTRSNGIKAKSTAFKFSYDKELESGNDVGALFSYRKTKSSDVYGSKSTNIVLSPYYKYYYTVNDKVEVTGVANVLLSTKSMDSALFNNFSYLEYGLGVSAIPSYYLDDKWSFSFPLGLQMVKKRINSGAPASIDFIVDAINNLGYQKSMNYGVGVEYAFKENWYANFDVLQTREIGADATTSKDVITYLNLRTTYYGELFNYALGYKTVKNVTDYSENAYMVSVQYNW